MRKKIFIIGIGGLLGYNLGIIAKKEFQVFGSYNFRKPDLEFVNLIKLDLKDFEKAKKILEKIKPDFLVNTAAISSVDFCEKNIKECQMINTTVVENLVKLSKDLEIKLVQISTDSVFDGTKDLPYVEEDKPNPINEYGKSKLKSEEIVLKQPKNLVIRVSVLYGWLPRTLIEISSSSKKSLNFAQWLIQKLKQNEEIKIVTDEVSSPIIADDLAKSIIHLIKNDQSGVFHSAPEISINRYEFSKNIAQIFKLNTDLILPLTVKELGREVNTGKNKSLNSKKIINTGFKFLTLQDSLIKLKEKSEVEH